MRRSSALGLLQSIGEHAGELSEMFNLDTGNAADIDALLEEADEIRRKQSLPGRNSDSEHQDDSWYSLGDRDAIEAIIQTTCEHHEDVALILVGVDNIRELNRDAGTHVGDLAMRRAAESIVRACREAAGKSAEVYRFVGVEMAVVLRGEFVEKALTLAERIRAAVRLAPFADETIGMRAITASIGVASTSSGGSGPQTHDELLRAAMVALSEARRTGGDSVASCDDPDVEKIAA
jgi:diguanylate cyclase (GGDEF)-like protein